MLKSCLTGENKKEKRKRRYLPRIEPRLSVPDFVSQLWRKIGGLGFLQSCETKSGTESLGSRLPRTPLLSYQCFATELQSQDEETSKVSSSEDNWHSWSRATRAKVMWQLSRVYQHSDTHTWTLDPAMLMLISTVIILILRSILLLTKSQNYFIQCATFPGISYIPAMWNIKGRQISPIRPIILGPAIFTKLFYKIIQHISPPHFQESYMLCEMWKYEEHQILFLQNYFCFQWTL